MFCSPLYLAGIFKNCHLVSLSEPQWLWWSTRNEGLVNLKFCWKSTCRQLAVQHGWITWNRVTPTFCQFFQNIAKRWLQTKIAMQIKIWKKTYTTSYNVATAKSLVTVQLSGVRLQILIVCQIQFHIVHQSAKQYNNKHSTITSF